MQKSVKASSILPGLKPDKFSRLPVLYNEARESLARSKVQEEEKSAQFADKVQRALTHFLISSEPFNELYLSRHPEFRLNNHKLPYVSESAESYGIL